MAKQRISYVPLDKMDARMRAEMERCQREGTPRPESSAVRAHVPACFWFFAESWNNIFRNGEASDQEQFMAARVASGGVAIGSIVLALLFQDLNVAFLVALAFAGVLWLTAQYGRPPLIALGLAVSFAIYGLVRKLVAVDPVAGLGLESLLPVIDAERGTCVALGVQIYDQDGQPLQRHLVLVLAQVRGGLGAEALPVHARRRAGQRDVGGLHQRILEVGVDGVGAALARHERRKVTQP